MALHFEMPLLGFVAVLVCNGVFKEVMAERSEFRFTNSLGVDAHQAQLEGGHASARLFTSCSDVYNNHKIQSEAKYHHPGKLARLLLNPDLSSNKTVNINGIQVQLTGCTGAGGNGLFLTAKTSSGDPVGVKFHTKFFSPKFNGCPNSELIKSSKPDHQCQRYFVTCRGFGSSDLTLNNHTVHGEIWNLASGKDLASGYEKTDDPDFPAKFKTCPCSLVLHVFRQVFEAILFLWDVGLEHADIQLSNIMMDSDANVQLVDYDFVPREDKSLKCGDQGFWIMPQWMGRPKDAIEKLKEKWCPVEDGQQVVEGSDPATIQQFWNVCKEYWASQKEFKKACDEVFKAIKGNSELNDQQQAIREGGETKTKEHELNEFRRKLYESSKVMRQCDGCKCKEAEPVF